MLLSILIPTYNRAAFLKKNCDQIIKYIYELSLEDEVELIISNNFSDDSTDDVLMNFTQKHSKSVQYFSQSTNIGLEKNALFTLKKSKADFVMFLGDDDFFDKNYLLNVIEFLKTNVNPVAVIPSFVSINIQGDIIMPPKGRDLDIKSKVVNNKFSNLLNYSWRGHQLSGLVFYRKGLYSSYVQNKVSNIYPFIYFLSLSMIKGNTLHFTDYPIKVTQPGQEKKDWGYGKDGLITEIFDNYKKIKSINYFKKTLLQIKLLFKQEWRLHKYKNNTNRKISILVTLYYIVKNKNTLVLTKLLLPFIVFMIYTRKVILKTKRVFG